MQFCVAHHNHEKKTTTQNTIFTIYTYTFEYVKIMRDIKELSENYA